MIKRTLTLAVLLIFVVTSAEALPKPNWHKVKKAAIYAGVAGAAVAVTLLADRDRHSTVKVKCPKPPKHDD